MRRSRRSELFEKRPQTEADDETESAKELLQVFCRDIVSCKLFIFFLLWDFSVKNVKKGEEEGI
jgi:hypothetical protein